MKIPLVYPKIHDTNNCPLKKCFAFEKLDGTNIHFIWEKLAYQILGNGWVAFGTRRDRFLMESKEIIKFIKQNNELKLVISDFEKRLSQSLNEKFGKAGYERVCLFTEFFGEKSFAGSHDINDVQKHVLIDIQIDEQLGKNIFLAPSIFIKEYYNFGIPKIVYQGKYNGQFVEDVRAGKYPVKEGVIVKGLINNQVYMAKIKTDAYMNLLKNKFGNNWENYWE